MRTPSWTSLKLLATCVAAWNTSVPGVAQDAQKTTASSDETKIAAEGAALNFLARYEEGDLGEVYDTELSPTYRILVAKPAFVQQGNFMRLQSGGRAVARELVGSQPYAQTPTGQTGNYFYVRHRTRHPNGLVFQDVHLEMVGGEWKVMGFWTSVAPQQ